VKVPRHHDKGDQNGRQQAQTLVIAALKRKIALGGEIGLDQAHEG
jgi:hypothetical protein